MTDPKELAVKIALDTWNQRVKQGDAMLAGLTDEQLLSEIAPGKNRGVYLLGHLASVHDKMLPLLGFGEVMYPGLSIPYVENADKAVADSTSLADLRYYWTDVNNTLASISTALQPMIGLRAPSVSEEDFAKEPHRNKLGVLVSRTNHLSYHLGQLVLLKK